MIRVCSRLVIGVACIFGLSSAADAAPILDLFNTGVVAPGVPLPGGNGTPDPHYTVVSGPVGVVVPVTAVTYFNGAYFADSANSRWISSSATGFPGSGRFVFQTTFTLSPLFNPAATSIQARCATAPHRRASY